MDAIPPPRDTEKNVSRRVTLETSGRRPTQRRKGGRWLAATVVLALVGSWAYLVHVRPIAASLEAARPFQMGRPAQVVLQEDERYNIWTDHGVKGLSNVICFLSSPDSPQKPSPVETFGRLPSDWWRPVFAVVDPESPRDEAWVPSARLTVTASGVHTVTCRQSDPTAGMVDDAAWFAVAGNGLGGIGRGRGSYSFWAPAALVGLVGAPFCLVAWLVRRRHFKKPSELSPIERQVDQMMSPLRLFVEATREGQQVTYTQGGATGPGLTIMAAGDSPDAVAEALCQYAGYTSQLARTFLAVVPAPVPIIADLDADGLTVLAAALRDAGATVLGPDE
jgi:hypothetical protein